MGGVFHRLSTKQDEVIHKSPHVMRSVKYDIYCPKMFLGVKTSVFFLGEGGFFAFVKWEGKYAF